MNNNFSDGDYTYGVAVKAGKLKATKTSFNGKKTTTEDVGPWRVSHSLASNDVFLCSGVKLPSFNF